MRDLGAAARASDLEEQVRPRRRGQEVVRDRRGEGEAVDLGLALRRPRRRERGQPSGEKGGEHARCGRAVQSPLVAP